ncbi:hypothetical protein Hdeb2414_s0020g00561621 [Helianthus debilis subsp. tardiflorus]
MLGFHKTYECETGCRRGRQVFQVWRRKQPMKVKEMPSRRWLYESECSLESGLHPQMSVLTFQIDEVKVGL